MRDHGSSARVGSELDGGLRLQRLLAVGAVGAVYAADGHPSGSVAVKVIHPELRPTLEMLTGLRIAEDVAHPRAVAPLDFIGGALHAVVMPLISGESAGQLAKRRRGRIPPSEALRIACEVLELIGTSHALDLCHGALSLSHLLIDDHGSVHVIGFGEARLRTALGLGADRAFVAPDHDQLVPSVGGDLWAVAAILFALITGQSPRETREPSRIRSLDSVSSRAPRELVELLGRALASDPDRRFSDAGTLLAAMKQAAAARDVLYAHPLTSSLAARSGSHAMLDPARMTQPPLGDPSWSSVPPASPHLTPPSRPVSRPPPAPGARPASSAPPPRPVSRPPPALAESRASSAPTPGAGESAPPLARATPAHGGQRPPSRAPDPRRRPLRRATLPPALDPLATPAEPAASVALRDRVIRGLELQDWGTARSEAASDGSAFAADLAAIARLLGSRGDSTAALADELAHAGAPEPERLLRVAANSLEGSALPPTLAAFGPALREHVEAAAARQPDLALELLTKIRDAVHAPPATLSAERQKVLAAVASPEIVRGLFVRLGARGASGRAVDGLANLLPTLGPTFAPALASCLVQDSDLSLQAKVRHHLESELAGHEGALGELARDAEPNLGVEVVRLLARIETLASLDALRVAAQSRHPAVRLEALGSGSTSNEAFRHELKARLEDGLAVERIHVLRALADHEVRFVVPFVALRIKSPHFDGLELEERRALFRALAVLAPARAEAVAIEILDHKKFLSLGSHEETRALAAATLGEIGRTEAALESLSQHAERHLGTSDRVRRAALAARDAVHARRTHERGHR